MGISPPTFKTAGGGIGRFPTKPWGENFFGPLTSWGDNIFGFPPIGWRGKLKLSQKRRELSRKTRFWAIYGGNFSSPRALSDGGGQLFPSRIRTPWGGIFVPPHGSDTLGGEFIFPPPDSETPGGESKSFPPPLMGVDNANYVQTKSGRLDPAV